MGIAFAADSNDYCSYFMPYTKLKQVLQINPILAEIFFFAL